MTRDPVCNMIVDETPFHIDVENKRYFFCSQGCKDAFEHSSEKFISNYLAHRDAFQFIVDVPADWQDTRVLHARIGDYLTIARRDRASDDWYLGSITDENGRILQAALNFLDSDRKYVAQIYRDGEEADWKTRPLDYVIEERLVDNATVLALRLAPGGGTAVCFYPASNQDIHRLSPGK